MKTKRRGTVLPNCNDDGGCPRMETNNLTKTKEQEPKNCLKMQTMTKVKLKDGRCTPEVRINSLNEELK